MQKVFFWIFILIYLLVPVRAHARGAGDNVQGPTYSADAQTLGEVGDESDGSDRRSTSFWRFFNRPKKDNPSEQLRYTQTLEEKGKIKKAIKQLKALVVNWPDSREAPYAQLAYARLLDRRNKPQKAFDAYQFLMEDYPGRFPDYHAVLERQFDIASTLMEKRKGKFFVFPGFYAPERAVPLFESLISNGPNWEKAPEAQFKIGVAHLANDDYELAILAFGAVQQRYGDSSFAEEAAFLGGRCYYLIAAENPHSMTDQEKAWAALTLFIQSYPVSTRVDQAKQFRDEVFNRMAKAGFDRAVFYEKLARRPSSGLVMYKEFMKEFPNSEWTTDAQTRIQELEKVALPIE